MGRVQDKVVLITGAASGVGKENGLLLAREGARVVLTDIDEEGVQALAGEIGANAIALRHDIADEGNWKTVIGATLDRFGKLDVLVNNAAILAMASIEETTLALWQKIQKINADGYFLGCKYGVEAMKQNGGAIINMSSLAAISGLAHFCAYSASKGSVTALTRSVAAYCKQRGYGIRCNSIHPDGILTPMVMNLMANIDVAALDLQGDPMARMCMPRDVSNLVLFLASDEARFINGAELRIDNGQASIDV